MSLTTEQTSEIIEGSLTMTRGREHSYFFFYFNDLTFTDQDCLVWTGWTRSQFQSMLDCLQITQDSVQRDKITALLIFWVKLKTGFNLSFQQIESLLNRNTDS